jgi:hypothetical protein
MTTDQREQLRETIYALKIERARLDGKIEALAVVLEGLSPEATKMWASMPPLPETPKAPRKPEREAPVPTASLPPKAETAGPGKSTDATGLRSAIVRIIKEEVSLTTKDIRAHLRTEGIDAGRKDVANALYALKIKKIIEQNDNEWSLVEREAPAPVKRAPRGVPAIT